MSKQAQDLMDEDGKVIDDQVVKNIDKINEIFLSLNQQFMNVEKQKLMRELGLVPVEELVKLQEQNAKKVKEKKQNNKT